MVSINRAQYYDKVRACWIGKNIGGTMGTPYECRQELLDVSGFSTPEGVALPNDDLDLQLVWLLAMEKHGPYQLNANILAEYWISCITPNWNEYGVGKANLRLGLLPPMSGEYVNSYWRNSNGAWIRSELWACLAPGCPDTALRYAYADSCVDHGMGEGTYAEFFTAAVESAAFLTNDVQELIEIGLSKIPPDCRLAKSIRYTVESHRQGIDWKTVRSHLVEMDADIGWFQAPANVSYVVLGLLYGEGDFKKSMLCAINCGDDTDCTGATIGSIMGIMHGTAGIPADWSAHVGDQIVTVAVDGAYRPQLPSNCEELTQRVTRLAPIVLAANGQDIVLCDGETCLSDGYAATLRQPGLAQGLQSRSGFSYDIDLIHTAARVEFDGAPVICPGETIPVKIHFTNQLFDQTHLGIRLYLPAGWSASQYRRDVFTDRGACATWTAEITAGETVETVNRVVVEAVAYGRPNAGYVPITILG